MAAQCPVKVMSMPVQYAQAAPVMKPKYPVQMMLGKQVQVIQPQQQQPKPVVQQKALDPLKVEQAKQKLVARHVEAIIARVDKIFADEINYVADYDIQYGKDPEGTVSFAVPSKITKDEQNNFHIEYSKTMFFGVRLRQFLTTNVTKLLETEKLTVAQRKFYDVVFDALLTTCCSQPKKFAPRIYDICCVEKIADKNFSKSLLLQSITLEFNSKVNPQLIELFK